MILALLTVITAQVGTPPDGDLPPTSPAAMPAPVQPPPLELRGSTPPPPGTIIAVDAAGVHLSMPGVEGIPGAPHQPVIIIGWDRIRSVHGEHAERASAFASVAADAWRARTRLERGDTLAAEPLFDKLFERYRGMQGATASVVAEGLLRCRLRRGAHIAAIDPWLALLQSRSAVPSFAEDWALQAGLPPVLDRSTGLIPSLPPIWLPWPALDAFARSGGGSLARGYVDGAAPITQPAPALAALYLHAARIEAGIESAFPQIRPPASADPGVQLVMAIAQSRSLDPDVRQRGRQRLEDRLSAARASGTAQQPMPGWMEAWCRAALGRSLLRETAVDARRHGVLELLHLPARFGSSQPYLAGLALAEAAAALRELGDHRSADILARELTMMYPNHPVQDWAPWRRSPANAPTGPRGRSATHPNSALSIEAGMPAQERR